MSYSRTLFDTDLLRCFCSMFWCFAGLVGLTMFPIPVLSSKSNTVLCPLSEYIDDTDKTVREFFECPGADDPPENTLCCSDKCCPTYSIDSVLQVDLRIAMIISLTVIVICVISGIVIIICCFASSCPLYEVCTSSGGWHSKADENATLPFSWATEYNEAELVPPANGKVTSAEKNHNHRLAESGVDKKDIEIAAHV